MNGFTPPKPSTPKPPKPDHSNTAPQFIKGMSLEPYMKQGAKRSKKPSSSGVQKQSKGVDPNVSATVGEGGQILNFDGKGTAQSDLSSESSDAFAEGKSDDDVGEVGASRSTVGKTNSDTAGSVGFDTKATADGDHEDKSVAGMRLDTYMEKRVKYNQLRNQQTRSDHSMTMTHKAMYGHQSMRSTTFDPESVTAHVSDTSYDK